MIKYIKDQGSCSIAAAFFVSKVKNVAKKSKKIKKAL